MLICYFVALLATISLRQKFALTHFIHFAELSIIG